MYNPKKENETYQEFENRWKAEFKASLRKDERLRAVEESVNGGVVVSTGSRVRFPSIELLDLSSLGI